MVFLYGRWTFWPATGTGYARNVADSGMEVQMDYRPKGDQLQTLAEIPPLDWMLQTQLSGSGERALFAKNSLTEEQREDIADIEQGISLIGVSGLGYALDGAADGIWRAWDMAIDYSTGDTGKYGGTLSWYPEFTEDRAVRRYDACGQTGESSEHRYQSLLTYHFQEDTDISAFVFVTDSPNGFPQAGDVYTSADGREWTLAGSWDRCALREAGDDYAFQPAYMDYMGRTDNCKMLGFQLGISARYIRFAFTSGCGRDSAEQIYADLTNSAGNIMSLRELVLYGNEPRIWGKEERLYNGILLEEGWLRDGLEDLEAVNPPVQAGYPSDKTRITAPEEIPYLKSVKEGGTRPDVIDITVGRQLFVDDFLVEETDLERNYHRAEKYEGNPILFPETRWEIGANASPVMTSGGLWYDMEENQFKMWYSSSFGGPLAYAVSNDGIHWERPALNEDGSNLILREWRAVDSTAFWLDEDAPDTQRYKMLLRLAGPTYPCYLYTSADGIHWDRVEDATPPVEDRSTFFYNAFRKKWVLSAKQNRAVGRARGYAETDDFTDAWKGQKQIFWQKPDNLDEPDPVWNVQPQLYNFDAIAYESIMIGKFQIWRGPENDICQAGQFPKTTELEMAYSRDGFHFDRPDRTPFIEASRQEGVWDRGYLQSPAGGVIIFDDELWFYYSGFSGSYAFPESGSVIKGMHTGGSIGLATLRRDGFASFDGSGTILTRPLTADGEKKYLFVNVKAPEGVLKAEIVDRDGVPVPGYTLDECLGVNGDTTKAMVQWKDGADVSFLNGSEFRIRFAVEAGEFYSFWLAKDETGGSDGMTAAGLVSSADRPEEKKTSESEDATGSETKTTESEDAAGSETKTTEGEDAAGSETQKGIGMGTVTGCLAALAAAAGCLWYMRKKKYRK